MRGNRIVVVLGSVTKEGGENTMAKSKKVSAVIDCTTGTVLNPSNLWYVTAAKKEMDKADNSDSAAFDLARKKGKLLRQELLEALVAKDIVRLAESFQNCQIDHDLDGQIVIYTGIVNRKKRS
jgi:hypothetical protein